MEKLHSVRSARQHLNQARETEKSVRKSSLALPINSTPFLTFRKFEFVISNAYNILASSPIFFCCRCCPSNFFGSCLSKWLPFEELCSRQLRIQIPNDVQIILFRYYRVLKLAKVQIRRKSVVMATLKSFMMLSLKRTR